MRLEIFLVIILCAFGEAVEISEIPDHLEVTISRGAHITEIDDVLLYTDTENAIFTFPDLPDPPQLSPTKCNLQVKDDEACALYHGLQQGLQDTSDLLAVINRVLTSKGLSEKIPDNVQIPNSWLNIIKGVSVTSNLPDPDLISAAGDSWFNEQQALLMLRRLQSNSTQLSARERRSAKFVIKAGLKLAKFAFNGNLASFFQRLFVGDFDILSYLTRYKILTKEEFKIFADLPRRVSELQTSTKTLLLDVLNSTASVKHMTNKIQSELNSHAFKLATIENSFLLEQQSLADLVRLVYTSTVYSVHLSSFVECRSNSIPLAVVPPKLLQHRLAEIQSKLPENVKMAIPLDEYERYYRLPLSKCIFDSNGGIVSVSIPLVEKSSDLHLFDFKPLQFGHNDMTCAVETQSSYIVKDVPTNKVYTVTEIDEELCNPKTTGLCRVPFSAAEDSNNLCVAVLMSGESASVIKETCRLQCFTNARPTISQINTDNFVGTHLPIKDTRMECGNEVYRLDHEIKHGSVSFNTVCNCKIFVGNTLMGKSTSKFCDEAQRPSIEHLLPVQMTKFSDLISFSSLGSDNTKFSHAEEIYNTNFMPSNSHPAENDEVKGPIIYSTVVWNFVQSLAMLYLYFRISAVATTVLTMGNNFPMVRGAGDHTCALPEDAYFLLWSILAVCTLSLLPGVFMNVYNFFKDMYKEHVLLVAQRLPRDDTN